MGAVCMLVLYRHAILLKPHRSPQRGFGFSCFLDREVEAYRARTLVLGHTLSELGFNPATSKEHVEEHGIWIHILTMPQCL